jgi:hypothetical protein
VLAALVLVALGILAVRTDPIGPLAGTRLSGEEVPYPEDWSFTDDAFTIAVESRPEEPHSVTTLCFVHDGALHVPALRGSSKDWPTFVLEDPRVRLKIGDRVFVARATRVEPDDPAPYFAAAAAKYEAMAERDPDDIAEDLWLFRIDPREE